MQKRLKVLVRVAFNESFLKTPTSIALVTGWIRLLHRVDLVPLLTVSRLPYPSSRIHLPKRYHWRAWMG